MRRLPLSALLPVVPVALAAAGCASLRVDLPPEAPAAAAAAAPAPPLAQAWKVSLEAGAGSDALAVAGRYVLVGTRKGTLVAIDAERGKLAGQTEIGASSDAAPLRVGDVVWASAERGRYGLVRYDMARGARASRAMLRESVRAPMLRTGDLVVAAARGRVVAFDAATGDERWARALGGDFVRSAPVAVGAGGDDGIVTVDVQGAAARLDRASGAVRWRAATAPVTETPVVVAAPGIERVIVPTTRGRLVALDAATGRSVWALVLPDTTVRFSAPARIVGSLDVVVGATDGRVRRVDGATGAVVWAHDVGSVVSAAPLVAAAHDVAYVGTHGRRLVALRLADGANVWEASTGGRVKTAPVVAGSCVVVVAEPRSALCFRPASPLTLPADAVRR